MSKIFVRDDLKYLLFSDIYHRLEAPKAKRKAFSILEAAIQCFAQKGFDRVTLEMIAREAGVTRPLIKHYFKNLSELEDFALKYIRLLFQKLAVEGLSRSEDPRVMLSEYVDACLYWTANFRTHALVWFSFLQRCGRNSKSRKMNTLAVKTGEERITTLVERGIQKQVFRSRNAALSAKMVQVLITGAVLTSVSEDHEDPKRFSLEIQHQAMDMLGAVKLLNAE